MIWVVVVVVVVVVDDSTIWLTVVEGMLISPGLVVQLDGK